MNANVFIYLEFLRKTLLELPGVTEKLYVETPAFYVNKKIFARLWEDGETLVVGTRERDRLMQGNADTYYVTNHYLNYDYVLVRLEKADPDELRELLLTAWRNRATKKLINTYDNQMG
jgi:hypothetical protein